MVVVVVMLSWGVVMMVVEVGAVVVVVVRTTTVNLAISLVETWLSTPETTPKIRRNDYLSSQSGLFTPWTLSLDVDG